MSTECKHPEVKVSLVGVDGNAFAIMGVVSKALMRAGFREDADEYVHRVMHDAQTYEEGIDMAWDYVQHEGYEPDDEDDAEGECWHCGVKTTYDDTVCEDCDEDDFDSDDDPEYDSER